MMRDLMWVYGFGILHFVTLKGFGNHDVRDLI